jgi:diacylglycerol kinase family enzyme
MVRVEMRALLIVNPGAGMRTAGPDDLDRASRILREAGFALDRIETGPDGPTAADLARRALDEGYEACIAAGGDGTVQAAAGALAGTNVVLGILPFGTYMNVAHGLGIPLAPLDAAVVIAKRRVRACDAGGVHGRIFFETAGVGLDAELAGAARHVERGRWRAALRRVWRYATHGTHRVRITIDGTTHAHRVMQILVLNSPYYGWAFPLLPDATMYDGILDVAVFPRMGRLALLRGVIALLRGNALPQRPVRYRGARIEMASDAKLTVHADGKIVGELPAAFTCRRGLLKVFA